jgi:hypothetical protein
MTRNRAVAAVVFTVAASVGCAQTGAPPRKFDTLPVSAIIVKNNVSKCLQLAPQKITVHGSIAKLTAQGTFSSSTGECGCTSALLSYSVVEERTPGHLLEWISAVISTRSAEKGAKREFDFVLSSDAALPVTGALTLSIRCTPH